MNDYFSAEIWNKKLCPDTSKHAKPNREKNVVNSRVIDAKFVTYRDAAFSGKFLLAKSVKLPLPETGWHKIEVYCRWFDHRLKTRGIKITVDMSNATVDDNYTGNDIVADITKTK